MKSFTLGGEGRKIWSFSHKKKKKKKLPKCVSGQLESFKTHLFLGEKKGVPPILRHFGPNFMNFATFSKYFDILGGKRKKSSLPEVLKNGFWIFFETSLKSFQN